MALSCGAGRSQSGFDADSSSPSFIVPPTIRTTCCPWSLRGLIGTEAPSEPRNVWAIRIRLQVIRGAAPQASPPIGNPPHATQFDVEARNSELHDDTDSSAGGQEENRQRCVVERDVSSDPAEVAGGQERWAGKQQAHDADARDCRRRNANNDKDGTPDHGALYRLEHPAPAELPPKQP